MTRISRIIDFRILDLHNPHELRGLKLCYISVAVGGESMYLSEYQVYGIRDIQDMHVRLKTGLCEGQGPKK